MDGERMSIQNDKLMNLADGKVLYDDLRGRVENVVKVSETEPSDSENKLWIVDDDLTEYQIPTMTDLNGRVPAPSSANKFLQTDSNGVPTWGSSASTADITSAVEDWMDENISGGSGTVVVDSSLLVQGAAADAKATGDAIGTLNNALSVLDDAVYVEDKTNIPGEKTLKQYYSNGVLTSDETYGCYRKISLGDAKRVHIHGTMSRWYDIYDFLSEDNTVLSFLRKTTTEDPVDVVVNVPNNAKYVCISSSLENTTMAVTVYLQYFVNEVLVETNEQVAENTNNLLALSSIEIEGYEKSEYADITNQATLVEGKYAEMASGVINIATGNYKYCVLDVVPGEIYKVTGMNYFDMRPAIFTDSSGNILYYSPTDRKTTAEHVTVEVTTPAGATKLYIDEDNNHTITIQKKGYYYVKPESESGEKITVTINKNGYPDTVILTKKDNILRQKVEVFNGTDQPNHAVLPRSVEVYMDDTWKAIVNNEDDNCPVNLSSGYIGAGHGYGRAFNLKLTGHGKTYADIGSKWVTNASYVRNFYIVRIIDEDNLIVLGAPDAGSDYDTTNYWGNSTTLTHVEGAVHTDAMTGYTKTQYLLAPVDKNHVKKILLDGVREVSENGEYSADNFVDVIDEYDIVNPQGIITEIVSNIPAGGYTENPAINTGDTFLHFSTVYRYLKDGTMLIFSLIDNDIAVTLSYWGGTQYAQKVPAGTFGGALFRYVPKLLSIDNHDLRTPFNMSSWNFTMNATSTYWEDEDNPPDRLLHLYTNGSNQYVAGFAVGYLPIAYGAASVRKSNISNAFYLYSTMKAYFRLVDNGGTDQGAWSAYTPLQCVIYRKPVLDVANIHTDAYFIPYGDKCYLYADYHAVADDRIKVPAEYVGKPITVVEKSSNVTVYGSIATDEIRIRCTTADPMYGYAVVKIG